jgi:hypothetical protein
MTSTFSASPISYQDRAWGQTAPAMNAAETVNAARRAVSFLSRRLAHVSLIRKGARKQEGVCMDLAQTRAGLLRNTAQTIIRGFGCWWMDLPACGWYMDLGSGR